MIGFFALALAFREEHEDRPMHERARALVCLYKPTLLLLLLPHACDHQADTKRYWVSRGRGGSGSFSPPLWKESRVAGVTSVCCSLLGPGWWVTIPRVPSLPLVLRGPGIVLFPHSRWRSWWASPSSSLAPLTRAGPCYGPGWNSVGAGNQRRRWSGRQPSAWTLVLNLYVPIYDSVLVVLSVHRNRRVGEAFPRRNASPLAHGSLGN